VCLLALLYRQAPGAGILLAANREERFDRASEPPALQPGNPAVICGTDRVAGGTWLGVNQHGVLIAVTNRPTPLPPQDPRSRGLLCRDLLGHRTAADAATHAAGELAEGRYAGANYLCVDRESAVVLEHGERLQTVRLEPGLHLLTNGAVNDACDPRLRLARQLFEERPTRSGADFLTTAQRVCSQRAGGQGTSIVIGTTERGTVSSTLIALADTPEASRYLHAPGPPDRTAYDDYSHVLRQVLAIDDS
jgi:uncharacterized protein with NRDE domain